MKIQLMNVARQHDEHKDEYEKAVIDVLRSGTYIGGQEVSSFEQEFASYQGAKYGISCGNGTDALVIALRALGIGDGDEVITVPWTFFATAESIAAVGAKPVFVDVDEKTYCIDCSQIERVITSKTKAILPVHFYGNSCDMDSLRKICEKHKLFLVADCAQAAGTKYKGERKNILGDVSCFSFFPTKNLGCDGDGGMILTDDEKIAKACRSLKVHGSGKDGLDVLKLEFSSKNKPFPEEMPLGESKYYNYLIGYNSRLDAVQASILRKKLQYLDDFVERRRSHAAFYNEKLKAKNVKTPFVDKDSFHSYYIYALQHKNAPKIIEKLVENGIGTGTYYPVPLHLQGAFYNLGYKEGDFPVSEKLAKTTFVLPVFPELTSEELSYIIDTLDKILEEEK